MIKKGRFGTLRGVVLLGVDLRDAREEQFVRMVCDGLSLGVAFSKAGFTSKAHDAPSNLFHLPRVQERAAAILEARRTQGVVTLGEVTSMLQRVFAGAHAAEEYSAAHNAAFSLARLYGHVTDRATLEVIRRPSRDPDAPSEMALGAWVEALPALPGPGPDASEPYFVRVADARAAPLGPDLGPGPQSLNDIKDLAAMEPSAGPGPLGQERELPSNINWLGAEGPGPQGPEREKLNEINDLNRGTTVAGRPENGAPSGPVTGTPNQRAQDELLAAGGPGYTPTKKAGPPVNDEGTGPLRGPDEWPSAEELFG